MYSDLGWVFLAHLGAGKTERAPSSLSSWIGVFIYHCKDTCNPIKGDLFLGARQAQLIHHK